MELAGDTLVLYGSALEEGRQAFGMLFARFDTSGHLIDYHICNDSLNDDFTAVYPNSLVKLSDHSGYVGVGQFFYRINGYLARFDNSGALIYLREFPDPTSQVSYYNEIKELDDGFLILGSKQNTDYVVNVFVAKTDFEGNIIWEKKYSTPNRQTRFGQVLILNENEYVIGATTTPVQGVPLPQIKNTSKIFAIDSLGDIKWQWESQPSLEELGVGKLSITDEGNWAYISLRGWHNTTYNEISIQPKFICRDSNFNIIREDTFGIADVPSSNGFANLIKMSDGGWLLIGVKPVNYPIPPVPMWYNSFSGWMVRLDSQGEQLWSRVDTAFWSVETGSTNYLYDAVELPGGSIVACGFSRTYEPFPKDWGWLIKVSKDGCLDTLFCNPVSTSFPIIPEKAVTLYPNPATSWVNIQSESIDKWDRIEVFNAHGQSLQAMSNSAESRIDISRLDDGIYFIRLIKAGQSVTKKVIKRR